MESGDVAPIGLVDAGIVENPAGSSLAWRFCPIWRASAIVFLCVAAAEPRTAGERIKISSRGVAVVVALDRSSSMTAKDAGIVSSKMEGKTTPESAETTRLEGAKRAFERFVAGRPDDAIGLVAFANYPDLICAADTRSSSPDRDRSLASNGSCRRRRYEPGTRDRQRA